MSYFDMAGSLRVVQFYGPAETGNATAAVNWTPGVCAGGDSTGNEKTEGQCDLTTGTWTAGYFTGAFDVTPYLGALIVVNIGTIESGAAATVTLKSTPRPYTETGDPAETWTTITDEDGNDMEFVLDDGDSDSIVYARVDASKVENAVGVTVVTTSGGLQRSTLGISCILFPQDTTNASEPTFKN